MAEDLTFQMGKFPALLPGGLQYARNHMWCRPEGERLRFGFTSYAVRLMQDVYFLEWSVGPGIRVALRQQIGNIETSKAVSDLFAPVAGVMGALNPALLEDPTPINTDNHGAGWLFEMTDTEGELLGAAEYYQFLDENWEKTQRHLKGHM